MRNQPTPEPVQYIDAQIASIMDPQSLRDTVLVTPGSPMPSSIPQGLTVAQTSRGVVITKNPGKVAIIDKGSDEQVGMALFGYAHDQSQGFNNVATATDRMGVPVAEIAAKPGDEQKVMSLVDMLAPEGGTSRLVPRSSTVRSRVSGLLGMIE
jgi:hypothetical protein